MTFWERAFGRKPTLYNLPAYVNKRIGKGQLLFMVDEAHESSKDVLEWLRVLVDQIESVSLILAGMPMLETDVLSKLETLNQRITTRIALTALSESETRSLIAKRIEAVGGKGTEPFSDAAITKIYSRTGGFPREVLKMADRLLNTALDKNIQVIDIDMIEEEHHEVPEVRLEEPAVTFTPRPPSDAQLANLPQKQRQIIEALNKTEWLTPAALTEQIEGEYASRGHAVRSINNILHRLMLDGYVQREARGKAFMYALTPKIKTMMVTS
jgi:hypothetical protein